MSKLGMLTMVWKRKTTVERSRRVAASSPDPKYFELFPENRALPGRTCVQFNFVGQTWVILV